MNTRGRTLKYTAVIGFVVLSLTGFSGRHHGIGKHHHGGGGCSSSSQDHDTSSRTTTTTGGSGAYSSPSRAASLSPAMAVLLKCATVKQPYATVEVSNPNHTAGTFEVTVTFRDAKNAVVDTKVSRVRVPASGTVTAKAAVSGSSARVDHCEVQDLAPAVS